MANFENTVKIFKEIHPQFVLLFQFGNFYRTYGRDALVLAYIFGYEANNTDNKERKHELQEKAVAYVKYLNFFLNLCYDKQIINNKKYLKFGEKLDIIVRYLVAWKNSEKKNIGV